MGRRRSLHLLFGLDIGNIVGIKSMTSLEEAVLGGHQITPEEDSWVTVICGVGATISAFSPTPNFLVDKLGQRVQ